MYLAVFLSSFLLLAIPCTSAVEYHFAEVKKTDTFLLDMQQTGLSGVGMLPSLFLVTLLKTLLKIYSTGFVLSFIFSLFFTIPIAIWITYFGSFLEIMVTAFALSFVTAVKWPVLLVDILLKIIHGVDEPLRFTSS